MYLNNAQYAIARNAEEPGTETAFVLERLPLTFQVRWYHDNYESAVKAYELTKAKNMKTRILEVVLTVKDVTPT
jgi:hypothetical protein